MKEILIRRTQAQQSLLASIEQAMQEKAQVGRASEARYGLVARMANATPQVNDTLRRTVWTRILAEGTMKDDPVVTRQIRAEPVRVRRFAFVTLTAVLLVTLVLTVAQTRGVDWNSILIGLPGGGKGMTSEDLDALAQAINGSPEPRTVVTYSRRALPVADQVRFKTVPIDPGEDASPVVVQDAVDAILPANGYVDLVAPAVHEDDTARQVRASMERSLFHLYQASGQVATEDYGVLERNTYLVGPKDVPLEPLAAHFEGGVELVAGSVLDEPQAGVPLRVALDWRVQEPVKESFVVFVHLVRGEFELVAQRDALPGNGLFPAAEWKPGELARDQFALLLPPDLRAGEYRLVVGIYDAQTQMRYSLVEPGSGTYVVIRNWDLPSPELGDQS